MSEVAEAAIRSQLYPTLSQDERALDLPQFLDDLKKQGYCYLVPQTIESVAVENIGPLKSLRLKFARGLNLVVGPNGSGKTALIKTIAHDFGLLGSSRPPYLPTRGKDSGTVKIRPYPEEVELSIKFDSIGPIVSRKETCILLDNPTAVLTKPVKQRFLKHVAREFDQAIITTQEYLSELCDANVLVLLNRRESGRKTRQNTAF
jgi:predicted ATP-dependent endonuclease of OLD family